MDKTRQMSHFVTIMKKRKENPIKSRIRVAQCLANITDELKENREGLDMLKAA